MRRNLHGSAILFLCFWSPRVWNDYIMTSICKYFIAGISTCFEYTKKVHPRIFPTLIFERNLETTLQSLYTTFDKNYEQKRCFESLYSLQYNHTFMYPKDRDIIIIHFIHAGLLSFTRYEYKYSYSLNISMVFYDFKKSNDQWCFYLLEGTWIL